MEVTLKKAAELSRALITNAKAIELPTAVTLSSFGSDDPVTTVAAARTDLFKQIERIDRMLAAGYVLRSLISAANSENAIDAMLTDVARIDEQLARLAVITGKKAVDIFSEEPTVSAEEDSALQRRVEVARREATVPSDTRRFTAPTTIEVTILGEADKSRVADMVAALKRQRSALKDKITLANFSTTISISTVANVLRDEKIID